MVTTISRSARTAVPPLLRGEAAALILADGDLMQVERAGQRFMRPTARLGDGAHAAAGNAPTAASAGAVSGSAVWTA